MTAASALTGEYAFKRLKPLIIKFYHERSKKTTIQVFAD
jgi:hypothetical protein